MPLLLLTHTQAHTQAQAHTHTHTHTHTNTHKEVNYLCGEIGCNLCAIK